MGFCASGCGRSPPAPEPPSSMHPPGYLNSSSATTFVSWPTAGSDPDAWPRDETRTPDFAPQTPPKGPTSGLEMSSNRKLAPSSYWKISARPPPAAIPPLRIPLADPMLLGGTVGTRLGKLLVPALLRTLTQRWVGATQALNHVRVKWSSPGGRLHAPRPCGLLPVR